MSFRKKYFKQRKCFSWGKMIQRKIKPNLKQIKDNAINFV